MYLIPLNDYSPSHIRFIYEFEADTIWKGRNYRYIYVVSSFGCGRSFTIGEEYLIYAGSGMSTGLCDGSQLIGPAIATEVLETLGAGQPPTAGTRAPRPLPGWHSKEEMSEILFDALYRILADQERERQRGEGEAPGWLIPTAAGVFVAVQVAVLTAAIASRRRNRRT